MLTTQRPIYIRTTPRWFGTQPLEHNFAKSLCPYKRMVSMVQERRKAAQEKEAALRKARPCVHCGKPALHEFESEPECTECHDGLNGAMAESDVNTAPGRALLGADSPSAGGRAQCCPG